MLTGLPWTRRVPAYVLLAIGLCLFIWLTIGRFYDQNLNDVRYLTTHVIGYFVALISLSVGWRML